MEQPLYYLASPYSHPSKRVMVARYKANVRKLTDLLKSGKHVFSPIVHNHAAAQDGDGSGWEFWKSFDEAMLRKCDELVVLTLDGWRESVGVTAEIELARSLGLEISLTDPV